MDALILPKPERLSALVATVGAEGGNGVNMYLDTYTSVHVLNDCSVTLRPCEPVTVANGQKADVAGTGEATVMMQNTDGPYLTAVFGSALCCP
jgi:hypothetical protein